MYRENYINSLRAELVQMVADHLTPVALRYGYSDVPLESNIKWRPQVLILGNYSSGKSTLINELLGAKIQGTGQAPTDDSFTILTYDDSVPADTPIQVTEERDGKVLLNDDEYPFETLKKHGERFASHFRLRKINSPFLKHLAIIDTPGMVDSTAERDRGYNYQEVIGSLAQIADLILVLFDPHKAGTVREAHTSIRETLPTRTFEDRVLFVLNRVDECASLVDLLRVYGTLCWNLSQITGRKDIPMIHLTYSPHAANNSGGDKSYLPYLENQREELKKAISQAPFHHLDHLASFIEIHGERLSHLLEALISYGQTFGKFRIKNTSLGFLLSLACGGAAWLWMVTSELFLHTDQQILIGAAGAVGLLMMIFWMVFVQKFFTRPFRKKLLKNIDQLTLLKNQSRQDSWHAIREIVLSCLEKTGGQMSLRQMRQEHNDLCKISEEGSREVREALKELSGLKDDEELEDSESKDDTASAMYPEAENVEIQTGPA